jgi:hypothetical protein
MGAPEVVVPITLLGVKELNVKGSFRYGVRGRFWYAAHPS